MTVDEVFEACDQLGVMLIADGSDLVVEAPEGILSPELVQELREAKPQILAYLLDSEPTTTGVADQKITIVSTRGPCICDPMPSFKVLGHLAHAGVGPDFNICASCGKRWQCKQCLGCRYCRTPG